MLVLSRKIAESIRIGGDVRITVLGVERNHVRIGIEAPRSVTILRAELRDQSAAGDASHGRAVESLETAISD